MSLAGKVAASSAANANKGGKQYENYNIAL